MQCRCGAWTTIPMTASGDEKPRMSCFRCGSCSNIHRILQEEYGLKRLCSGPSVAEVARSEALESP